MSLKKVIKRIKQKYIRYIDNKIPKSPNIWLFFTCPITHELKGNLKAVFEYVRNREDIKKIIISKNPNINITGKNIEILTEAKGKSIYLAKIIIIDQMMISYNFILSLKDRIIINVWHGIPLKRILAAEVNGPALNRQEELNHYVISSSKIDKLAMLAAFYPTPFSHIWITGLPRHDFITCHEIDLPLDMQQDLIKIKTLLKDKKLILFAPTFRQKGEYYKFSEAELNQLSQLLNKNNCILGVREHFVDTQKTYFNQLKVINAIDLSDQLCKHIELLFRVTDILITDYSSTFFDFLLTNKPVVSFAFDLKHYAEKERGFFYDLDLAFPGPICENTDTLTTALEEIINTNFAIANNYHITKRIFFDFNDTQNTERVVQQMLAINDN